MLVSLKYPASANTAPGRCPVLASSCFQQRQQVPDIRGGLRQLTRDNHLRMAIDDDLRLVRLFKGLRRPIFHDARRMLNVNYM
jgi:hypothetical protein